jgi:hypothetical protein
MKGDPNQLAGSFRKLYVEALERRNIDTRCTVCHNINWEPLFDAGLRIPTDEGFAGEGLPVTGAKCMTCGTIRLFDWTVLDG